VSQDLKTFGQCLMAIREAIKAFVDVHCCLQFSVSDRRAPNGVGGRAGSRYGIVLDWRKYCRKIRIGPLIQ
jgi:hypothetical protein